MEVKTLSDASAIFRCFATCPHDPKTLLLDVRPHKQFEKLHVALSYNIRLSANGRVLLVSSYYSTSPLQMTTAPLAHEQPPSSAADLHGIHFTMTSPIALCRTTRRTNMTSNSPRTAGETGLFHQALAGHAVQAASRSMTMCSQSS